MDARTVTACRLCDSTQLEQVLDLGETPLANELDGTELFPLVVMRCGDCRHHQLSIVVAPERLWGPDYPYQSGTSPVFRAHLEKLADEVAALKPGGRVLEIASNDGTLVRMLAERGLGAAGIDPSGPENSSDGAGPGHWITMQGSWPEDLVSRGPGLDCILALNVFAHVDDLHSFTAAVKEALAPDGVFIVEVGWACEVSKRNHFDTIYHEHLSYHTIDPLLRFFRRHGLVVVEAKYVASQGGSIRLYIKHAGKSEPVEVESWDDGGINMGSMRLRIQYRRDALYEALNKLFNRQEMVCIYGAPAKLTTLLYATGLQDMPFNCVGDDNPRKVGRTTPGNHIPIVSVEAMLARKPDTILVASWNFFDDIRDKLRAAGFQGGIINPMGDV